MGKKSSRVSLVRGELQMKLSEANRLSRIALRDPTVARIVCKANEKAREEIRRLGKYPISNTGIAVYVAKEEEATEKIDREARRITFKPLMRILEKEGYLTVTTGDLKAIYDLIDSHCSLKRKRF